MRENNKHILLLRGILKKALPLLEDLKAHVDKGAFIEDLFNISDRYNLDSGLCYFIHHNSRGMDSRLQDLFEKLADKVGYTFSNTTWIAITIEKHYFTFIEGGKEKEPLINGIEARIDLATKVIALLDQKIEEENNIMGLINLLEFAAKTLTEFAEDWDDNRITLATMLGKAITLDLHYGLCYYVNRSSNRNYQALLLQALNAFNIEVGFYISGTIVKHYTKVYGGDLSKSIRKRVELAENIVKYLKNKLWELNQN